MKRFGIAVMIVSGLVSFLEGHSQGMVVTGSPSGEVLKERDYTDVKGSAYLLETWESGSVIDETGKEYPNLLLRYNSYKDKIEAKDKGKALELDAKLYKQFTITYAESESGVERKRTFKNGFSDIPGASPLNYFEVLYDGKYAFLKRIKTDLIEETISNYGTGEKVKRFALMETYYILPAQGKTKVVGKLTKKNFIEALGSEGAKIESYLDKEKVKLKSEKSFVMAVAYLETL